LLSLFLAGCVRHGGPESTTDTLSLSLSLSLSRSLFRSRARYPAFSISR
jgi:hypothetical protein